MIFERNNRPPGDPWRPGDEVLLTVTAEDAAELPLAAGQYVGQAEPDALGDLRSASFPDAGLILRFADRQP